MKKLLLVLGLVIASVGVNANEIAEPTPVNADGDIMYNLSCERLVYTFGELNKKLPEDYQIILDCNDTDAPLAENFPKNKARVKLTSNYQKLCRNSEKLYKGSPIEIKHSNVKIPRGDKENEFYWLLTENGFHYKYKDFGGLMVVNKKMTEIQFPLCR